MEWILYDEDEEDERRRCRAREEEERERRMRYGSSRQRNVFISFDYDNDARLKDALVGQSKYPNSPFAVRDYSMKEAAPQSTWRREAKRRIDLCSVVVVMCGQRTDRAAGVSAEIEITRELGKPYFLLAGYSDRKCVKPKAANPTDKMYSWTWNNLEALLAGRR